MATRTLILALSLIMAGTLQGEVRDQPHEELSSAGTRPMTSPVSRVSAYADSAEAGVPDTALLSAIAAWLSVHFELPMPGDPPAVHIVSPETMTAIRCAASVQVSPAYGEHACDEMFASGAGHDVMGLYDDRTRTIFLRSGWTGANPSELSVLVHEMVHHVQNLGGLVYECADARERPAFAAQARWLEFYGRSLESEFALDPMTLLLRTNCAR